MADPYHANFLYLVKRKPEFAGNPLCPLDMEYFCGMVKYSIAYTVKKISAAPDPYPGIAGSISRYRCIFIHLKYPVYPDIISIYIILVF